MVKQYSFLTEGWFSKSDEEVGTDNIRNTSSRQYYEDICMFLECYSQLFFMLIALSDPYYTTIYNNVIKYHLKNKKVDLDELTFNDLDLPGQRIMQVIVALIESSDEGLLDKILDQLRKHLVRYEPRQFKSLFLECTFDSCYDDMINYLKDNKLSSLINNIKKEVDQIPLIDSLKEVKDNAKSYAKNDGYNIKSIKLSNKSVLLPNNKTSVKSLVIKSNKIPKSLFNSTPKRLKK